VTGGGWPRCRFGDLRPPAGDERTERRANNLCSSADRRGYRRVRASREVLGVDTDRPRQYLPPSTRLGDRTQAELDDIAAELNGRPRQTLGWMTPSQVLDRAMR
jgi:hypothetical protein